MSGVLELIKLHHPELTGRAAAVGPHSSHCQAVAPAWLSLSRSFGITTHLPSPDLRSEYYLAWISFQNANQELALSLRKLIFIAHL